MSETPVLIGLSSFQEKGSFDDLNEALHLMDHAAKDAIDDCGNPEIIHYIDEIRVPKGFWKYRDPGRWIALNNNINSSAKTYVTKIGVLQQNLINSVCQNIQKGKINAGLIIGAEARYKRLRAQIEQKEFNETPLLENPTVYQKADDVLYLDEEFNHLGGMAVGYYAIIETAIRKYLNNSPKDHDKKISELYSKFSKIAAKNNEGWISDDLSSKDIATPSKKNPLLAYPYNKYHCTSWNVNQTAALIICSSNLADKLQIAEEKRIYPLVSFENNHMIPILQRPKLYESQGLSLGFKKMKKYLEETNEKIEAMDLYSCFPSAVEMFQKELDNSECFPTITGGMSFAGGPLNSYVLQSTAQLLKAIRKNEFSCGLITGVSGMFTKQSGCIWSKNKAKPYLNFDVTQEIIDKEIPVPISQNRIGVASIVGYTVLPTDNNMLTAVVYAEDKSGRKILKSLDKSFIQSLMEEEWVGKELHFENGFVVL